MAETRKVRPADAAKAARRTSWRALDCSASRLSSRFLLIVLALLLAGATTVRGQAAAVKANASAAAAADRKATLINTGRIVFNQRCEICHFTDSRAKKIGPGLAGLFARSRLADGARVSESSVAGVISDGGKDMPGYQDLLKPGQLQALIAYLKAH